MVFHILHVERTSEDTVSMMLHECAAAYYLPTDGQNISDNTRSEVLEEPKFWKTIYSADSTILESVTRTIPKPVLYLVK